MSQASFNRLGKWFKKISRALFNHQVGVFLIFLVISTFLWFVTSLNEEVNRQLTCRIKLYDVPDSVTLISQPPTHLSASVRVRGTQLLRQLIGSERVIDINFRDYANHNRMSVPKTSLLELVQSVFGDDSQVQGLYPDSIGLLYTTLPPTKVPVDVKVTASTTPNLHIMTPITAVQDSVKVYAINDISKRIKSIPTADIHIENVDKTSVIRVPLRAPAGTRAVPDSVDIKISVEPYITINRIMPIEPVNVPPTYEMNLSPEKIKVSYRVPRSMKNNLPEINVIADYNTLNDSVSTTKIAINTDPWVSYIFLDADSVNYYLSSKSDAK